MPCSQGCRCLVCVCVVVMAVVAVVAFRDRTPKTTNNMYDTSQKVTHLVSDVIEINANKCAHVLSVAEIASSQQ